VAGNTQETVLRSFVYTKKNKICLHWWREGPVF